MANRRQNWRYPVSEVTLDRRVKRTAVRPSFCPRLVGCDMRVQGALAPHPGFKDIHTLGSDLADNETQLVPTQVSDCHAFTIQVAALTSIRGWVVRGTVSGSPAIWIEYYDSLGGVSKQDQSGTSLTDATGWRTVLLTLSGGTAKMDVVVNGRLVYVFREGIDPILFFIDLDGSTYKERVRTDTGPGARPPKLDFALYNPTGAPDEAVLEAGTYSLAYQLYDSKTGRLSALSEIAEITEDNFGQPVATPLLGGDVGEPCEGFDPDDPASVATCPYTFERPKKRLVVQPSTSLNSILGSAPYRYDQVFLYRSVRVEAVGGTYNGTVLFRDQIITSLPLTSPNFEEQYQLNDLALTFQDRYNDKAEFDEDMPKAGAAAMLDNTLFTGPDKSGSTVGRGVGELRWSTLAEPSVELFPADNRYVPRKVNDEIIRFVRLGDFLVGLSTTKQYFILKQGLVLAVREVHEGFGITGQKAACVVGSSIFMVTPQGMVEVDAGGNLRAISVVDELLLGQGDWASTVANVVGVYDPPMGCMVFLNPSAEQAVCYWMNTRSVSELEHCTFSTACAGQVPSDAEDGERAMFVTPAGRIMRFDHTYSKSPRYSFFDLGAGDYNFSANAQTSGATTVVASSGTVPSTAKLKGAKLVFTTGARKGEAYTVSSVSSSTITLASALAGAVAAGDRFTLSPVVFRVMGWPLGLYAEDGTYMGTDLFRRRIATTVGCSFGDVTGQSAAGDRIFQARVYRGLESSALATGEVQLGGGGAATSVVEGTGQAWAPLGQGEGKPYGASGALLFPEILIQVSDLHFQLLGFSVDGSIEDTDKDIR